MRGFAKKVLALLTVVALMAAGLLVLIGSLVGSVSSASAAGIVSATDFYVPGSFPWGTAFDTSGRVWVAMPGCDPAPSCARSTPPGELALFDPTTSKWVSVVKLPSGYGQPLFVTVDHAGKVWFTMPVTNAIARYDPVTATVAQWAVPTASAGPWDLRADSTGKIWFTEHYTNRIGSFNPTTHNFHEVATPATNSNPYGITIDASNDVWFTENTDAVALIGEYTNTRVLKEYKIRNTATAGTGLTPHLITIDPSGNIWWSEGWVSGVGKLKLSAAQPLTNKGVTEHFYTPSCSTCGSHTSGISTDSRGLVWVDDSLQNTFGSLPLSGGSFSFHPSPSAHPHDGLNVDSQNRIWFDEEFANKLAEAIPSATTSATTTTTTTTSSSTTTSTPSTTTTSTTVASSVLGSDTFVRLNQSLWGTAADGQLWGGDANTSSVFSIAGDAGVVGAAGGSSYSAVLGPVATDSEAVLTGSDSLFTNSNFGAVLRWTDANNWYKAYVDGVNLVIQKKVAGVATTLSSVPFAAAANTSYTIHFRALGSTLSANLWAASGTEPSGWMLTATDSSLASGHVGIRVLTQSAPATMTAFRGETV